MTKVIISFASSPLYDSYECCSAHFDVRMIAVVPGGRRYIVLSAERFMEHVPAGGRLEITHV